MAGQADSGIIRRGEDHEFLLPLKRRASANGAPENATGLTLSAFLSATEDGADLASTTTPLTARTLVDGNLEYYGYLGAATWTSAATGLSEVWERYTGSGVNRSRLLRIVEPGEAL